MDKIEKELYALSTQIKEFYKKIYETGSIDENLKDFLFLLKEENHLYESLSIEKLATYFNTFPDLESDDISSIMLGDASFDVLLRMMNKFQYFIQKRCMYSEELEMDTVPFSALMNGRWVYLYNEVLFEHLFYYYRIFISIKKEYGNYLLLSLLVTTYTYPALENRLVKHYLKQEQATNIMMKYSGISNIQESLDQAFSENLDACFESFINTDFNDMYHKEEEEIESSISQIFYLSLYSSISNNEIRNVFRNLYQPVNLPNLSLKHQKFLDELQQYFAVSDYEKQLKLK